MIPRIAVLRPEPGATRTAARARARGFDVLVRPLFETRPLAWEPPDPGRYDALLLTSAAAVRHAGPGLATYADLPVVAVGPETARAAGRAGLAVVLTGDAGVARALEGARARGFARFLHLAGRDRVADQPGVDPVPVYAGEALPVAPGWTRALTGRTALLHSPRAAARLAELVDRDRTPRAGVALAAISAAALAAAGPGWAACRAAAQPTDHALLALVSSAD